MAKNLAIPRLVVSKSLLNIPAGRFMDTFYRWAIPVAEAGGALAGLGTGFGGAFGVNGRYLGIIF